MPRRKVAERGRRKGRRVIGGRRRRGGAPTAYLSLQKIALLFPEGSLERVYIHGMWQRSRGRQPSLQILDIPNNRRNLRNPRLAFQLAEESLGAYVRDVFSLSFSRRDWFWTESKVREVQDRMPVESMSRPTLRDSLV